MAEEDVLGIPRWTEGTNSRIWSDPKKASAVFISSGHV